MQKLIPHKEQSPLVVCRVCESALVIYIALIGPCARCEECQIVRRL